MCRPRTPYFVCALLATALVWSLFSASGGAVVCIGPGGHVAVEAAHSGCDGSAADEHQDAGHVFALTSPSNCIDLPLGNGASSTPRQARPRDDGWSQLLPAAIVAVGQSWFAGASGNSYLRTFGASE